MFWNYQQPNCDIIKIFFTYLRNNYIFWVNWQVLRDNPYFFIATFITSRTKPSAIIKRFRIALWE